mgnify:CR=1 FL=1
MKRLLVILIMCYGVLGGISAQISGVHFPKMKPVQTPVFVSVGGATESPAALHICRIFQGIINRDSAEVFLSTGDKELDWFKYINVRIKVLSSRVKIGDCALCSNRIKTVWINW